MPESSTGPAPEGPPDGPEGMGLAASFKVHSAEFTFDVYRSLGEAPEE